MRITFYGKLASVLGRELDLAVDEACTIGRLREQIADSFPQAAQWLQDRRVRACVARVIVPDDHRVTPADEVEFFSPVSGG
jgi:sulfur-carrier protein